jgi:hypothetical protein
MPPFETAPARLAAESPVAPAATAVVQAEAAPSKFDVVVDQWFNDCIQNTEVGRYVGAYNTVFAALGELKQRLSKEI